MKILLFVPLFLFLILPPSVTSLSDLDPVSSSDTNDTSEAESEEVRVMIDDDDKLLHFPFWSFAKTQDIYTSYSQSCKMDGICRRLFKPPKA